MKGLQDTQILLNRSLSCFQCFRPKPCAPPAYEVSIATTVHDAGGSATATTGLEGWTKTRTMVYGADVASIAFFYSKFMDRIVAVARCSIAKFSKEPCKLEFHSLAHFASTLSTLTLKVPDNKKDATTCT